MPYGQTAPGINPNTFPYRRKWTQAETDELIARIEKLREAMVDMVGPSGVVMYIDAGTIAHIATHLALAGADLHSTDDARTYIWAERRPDETGIFEATVEWKVKKDHRPPPPPPAPDPEQVEREAAAARAQIYKQLTPEVRDRLIADLAHEFARHTDDPDTDGDHA